MQENPFTRPTRAPNVRQMKNWLLMLYGPAHKRELLQMVQAVDTKQKKEGALERMAKMAHAATNVTQVEEFYVKSGDGLRDDVIYYNNEIPCMTRGCIPNFPWWRKRMYYCCFCRLCGRGATRGMLYVLLATLFAMVFGAIVTAFIEREKGQMCGVVQTDKDVLFDCGTISGGITNFTTVAFGALTYNSDGLFDRQCSDGPAGVDCSADGLRELLMSKCIGKQNCRLPVSEATMGTNCGAAAAAGALRLWASVTCSTTSGKHGCVQNVNCHVQTLEPHSSLVLSKIYSKAKELDPFTVMKRVTSVFALFFMYLLQGRARNVKWTSRNLVYRTSTWHKTKRKVNLGMCGEHLVGLPRDCQWCPCSNNHMETIDAVHIRNVTMIQDPFQYRCGVGDVHVHVHARGSRKGQRRLSKVGSKSDNDCLSRLGCAKADLSTDTLVIEDVANVHDFYDFLNYKLEEDAGAGFISDYQPETVVQQPQAVPGGGIASTVHSN